jgi:hypothetical protein
MREIYQGQNDEADLPEDITSTIHWPVRQPELAAATA